jgi:aminopeptidase N
MTGSAAHRARQARYRERLRAERIPEADDVQREIFRTLRAAVVNLRRGRGFADEQYRAHIETFIRGLLKKSLEGLEKQGFDRGRARRRLALALIPPYPDKRPPKASADGG